MRLGSFLKSVVSVLQETHANWIIQFRKHSHEIQPCGLLSIKAGPRTESAVTQVISGCCHSPMMATSLNMEALENKLKTWRNFSLILDADLVSINIMPHTFVDSVVIFLGEYRKIQVEYVGSFHLIVQSKNLCQKTIFHGHARVYKGTREIEFIVPDMKLVLKRIHSLAHTEGNIRLK